MSKVKSSIKKESLEERLERIRKKNEEIEKKHQIAERDRLIAKMQNALVEIKPTSDDWPKEHKFDKLDITYDVPESALEAEKAAKMEQQQRRALKAPKFTDIPPDPTTFLADEERDGVQRDQNKDVKDAPRVNKGRALTGRKKFPKSASQNDFPESVGKPNPNWRRDDSAIDEKFTNLTVSVSQDGEFKSVRLTQAPVIGSGRVGPRQITKTQFQPMAQSQSFDKNNTGRKSDRKKPANEAGGNQRSQQWKGNNNSFNSHNKVNQLSTPVSKGTSVQDRLKRTPPMPTPHSDNIVKIENSNYSVDQTNIANQHTMLIHNYAPVNELVPGTQQYAQNA